ncbi:MAG: hypothetical protein Q9217_006449 [Psora testacea]
MSITPFKVRNPLHKAMPHAKITVQVHITESELDILTRKLELARLPHNPSNEQWGENNGVTVKLISETVDFWRNKYNWREEEAHINRLPQFKTPIDIDSFGTLDIHFVHSKSPEANAIPLLFLHGWPGSFLEVEKILPELNKAGFDVVAPSLPGYGFSSYTDKAGFKHEHHAKVVHRLMQRLGYQAYVVQGGDWGSYIARCTAILFPDEVKALHVNMVVMPKPDFAKEPEYTDFEKACHKRGEWFSNEESAYSLIQGSKPRTLGFAMHDSPVGMLAWMADKLVLWSDSYPWTPTELITWTLMYYFPGPTTGFLMYRENLAKENMRDGVSARYFVKVPTGVSAFPKELLLMPRTWAETRAKVVFWQEHGSGGHFAAYERPKELVDDVARFCKSVWNA